MVRQKVNHQVRRPKDRATLKVRPPHPFGPDMTKPTRLSAVANRPAHECPTTPAPAPNHPTRPAPAYTACRAAALREACAVERALAAAVAHALPRAALCPSPRVQERLLALRDEVLREADVHARMTAAYRGELLELELDLDEGWDR